MIPTSTIIKGEQIYHMTIIKLISKISQCVINLTHTMLIQVSSINLRADEIPEQHPGGRVNPQSDEDKVPSTPKMQRPSRRRGRRGPATLMDYEQTMIPGQMYQSWLQDASDIVSRRGKKRKHMGSIGSIKIARLMDLPPVSLVCGLVTNGIPDIYYPLPLLQQWMKITGPVHDSPSGGASPPHPAAPSSSSSSAPPVTNNYDDPF